MKRWLCVVALGAAACGAPAGSDAGTDGGEATDAGSNPAEVQAWLDAHNTERANAMPVPSPALSPYGWSETVAATARSWADGCRFVHNTAASYGENLFASSGGNATPAQIVNDWASEKANYTYSTNSCAAGKACGHYTQVVWRGTTSIGCASKVCTTGSPFGSGAWQLVVCDYDPPGNFVGQKPY
jgi:pathogenesis-related protein 1